jgi:hypothetical protein
MKNEVMIQEETSKSPIIEMAEKWVNENKLYRSAIVVLTEHKIDENKRRLTEIDPLILGEDAILVIGMAGAFIHTPWLSKIVNCAQEKAMAIVMGRDDDVF